MIPTIHINQQFRIVFSIARSRKLHVIKVLEDNRYQFVYVDRTPAMTEFTVHVTIRRAEICRQLLKNIQIYE